LLLEGFVVIQGLKTICLVRRVCVLFVLLCAMAALLHAQTLLISAPADGMVVNPGQVVTATVEASPASAFQSVFIIGAVHSGECLGLGFTPPFELGPDFGISSEVQIGVLYLLNVPLSNSSDVTLLH
jgi:hypothetical protein